jgi:hypothetical protein
MMPRPYYEREIVNNNEHGDGNATRDGAIQGEGGSVCGK